MVKTKIGNILDCEEDIIVHQVNVHGVMGGGLARQLADHYSGLEDNYSIFCWNFFNNFSEIAGRVYIYKSQGKYISNLFSQDEDFTTIYEALTAGLRYIKGFARKHRLSVAIPYRIGCGIANGDWNVVSKIIEDIFQNYDCTIYKLEEVCT